MSLDQESVQTTLLEANPEDFRLLAKAYRNIYQPAFPEADQRERLTDMKSYIQTNQANAQQYLILVTNHQSASGYERPVGIATANRLTNADATIAFFEHAAIHPSYRGQGLWSTITKARTEVVQQQAQQYDTKLAAIFAETEKPTLTLEEQTLPEERRTQTLEKRLNRRELFRKIRFSEDPQDKYYQLDFNYVQLPVRDHAQSITNLDLLVRFDPESRDNYLASGVPGTLLQQWLEMYFASFEVEYNYREHPDFVKMENELKELKNIPLKSII